MNLSKIPEYGSFESLPPDFIDEILDKINHIKKEGMWERFKILGTIYYSDDKMSLHYLDGDIYVVTKIEEEKYLICSIPFEQEKDE